MRTRAGSSYSTNRSLTNSLESTDGSRGGLRGAVSPNDHNSYARLGKILGLGNKKSVKEWMNGRAFRPAFERLYKSWIEVQQDAASQSGTIRKRGPDLRAVVDAIADPHAIAEERYTSPTGVDTSEFNELDHYALCLVALRASNMSSAQGLFRGKTCSQEEIDQRLWQAILRASSDMTIERRNKNRVGTHQSRYGTPPVNNGQVTSPKRRAETDLDEEVSNENNSDEHGDQNNPGPGNLPKPMGGDIPSVKSIKEMDEILLQRNYERLKATQDPKSPMNLATEYGRYLTVHTALEFFHSPLEIQRQVANEVFTVGEDNNQKALSAESRAWLEELESSITGNRIPMRTVTSDDTDRVSQMEALLDNPLYQRMDYDGACKALGITDPNTPHLPGMPTTAILKSWQVTGVKALVDFEANPQLSACVLADATGLGKTIELLAFWVFVRVIYPPVHTYFIILTVIAIQSTPRGCQGV